MRSATAGLAANDSTMPSTINARKAERNHRSIVHHQLATSPRSTRLTIRSSDRLDAFELPHHGPERIAPNLEISELVETRAGGRKQHNALLRPVRRGIPRRVLDRRLQRARYLVAHGIPERCREDRRRLADQIGFGDAREIAAQDRKSVV